MSGRGGVLSNAERFAAARSARLATVSEQGQPHLIPVVFAVADSTIYTAVDGKPKTTRRLRRLANIEANPRVSLLVDEYSELWDHLWWIRADGRASILADGAEADRGRAELRTKYVQYQTVSLDGPVIAIEVTGWSAWSAASQDPAAGGPDRVAGGPDRAAGGSESTFGG